MSNTGKNVTVLRRSPVQQNGYPSGGKGSKTPQSRGTKSSKTVLAPMNGEVARQDNARSSGMRGRSSSFGKEEINLMAVRKVDPSVSDILSTVPQVMLYEYDQTSGEWERTSTEGTLFIYSRGTDQRHGFMILNRLSNDNMLEEIVPNMGFRVQSPFVLFKKKSGKIFGLCFQEEASCQETGELLNSLGSQQENLLPVNGHHYSPKSTKRNPSLNASMRSTSAPAFKHSTVATNGKAPYLIDVLENCQYTSSEGESTSSPDSLTSDPISFLASSSSAHQSGGVGGAKSHHGKVNSTTTGDSVSPRQQTKASGGSTSGKKSVRTSSPRNVPAGSKGGQRSHQQSSSGSVSPVKGSGSGRSRSPKQHQKQNGGSGVNLSSSVGGPGPRTRGGMRHAVSFDQGLSPVRSYTTPQPYDHLQRLQPSSAFERLAAQVNGHSHGDKTVRRLFSPDMSVMNEATPMPHPPVGVPSSLQSIFSQVTSAADSTTPVGAVPAGGTSGGVLPLKVISLEQVEKQIVEDVPSPPVSINPLAIFGVGGPFSGPPPQPPSGQPQQVVSHDSSQHRLLQPSAFMSSGDNTNTHHHVTSTSQTSITAPKQQGLTLNYASGNVSQAVAISVEPPSPVVNLGTTFSSSGTTVLPKTSQFPGNSAPVVTQDQYFPAIPPLMHSPGMRAAPVSSRQQQPKSRGEPSSLATTTASANVQPSSTTQTTPSKTSGKLSQQVGPSEEEKAVVLPSTPQKYTSQPAASTQLTPLAELSVPRRSATAPVGLPATGSGALMSPHQFAHSTTAGGDGEYDHTVTADVDDGSKVKRKGAEPAGLTREQLQQALLYLIKHDDEFVNKLHEAYQMSLSEKQV